MKHRKEKRERLIQALSDGRFRVQLVRRGWQRFDRIYASREEAIAARDAALKEREPPQVVQQSSVAAGAGGMTLKQAWERYLVSQMFAEKKTNTRQTEKKRVVPVLAALGSMPMRTLEDHPECVQEYVDARSQMISERTKRVISGPSIRLELAALSSVVSWAVGAHVISKPFMRMVRRPKPAKRKVRVSPRLQAKLVALSSPFGDQDQGLAQDARFMSCLRVFGCRPIELATLKRGDVSFELSEVVFRDTKHEREDRRAYMPELAASMVQEQLEYAESVAPNSPFVFSTQPRALRDRGTWRPFNWTGATARLRAAGIVPPEYHAHANRREHVSAALEAEIPIDTVMLQTGHHDYQSVALYKTGLRQTAAQRQTLEKHIDEVQRDMAVALNASKKAAAAAAAPFKRPPRTKPTLSRIGEHLREIKEQESREGEAELEVYREARRRNREELKRLNPAAYEEYMANLKSGKKRVKAAADVLDIEKARKKRDKEPAK